MQGLDLKRTRPVASAVLLVLVAVLCLLAVALWRQELAQPWLLLAACALPHLWLLLPAVLSFSALRTGRVTALAAAALIMIGITAINSWAGWLAALVLLPAPCFAIYSYDKKLPFWFGVGICAALLLLGGMAAMFGMTRWADGNLVEALAATIADILRQNKQNADMFLTLQYSMGLLTLPDKLANQVLAFGSTVIISPSAVEELAKQFIVRCQDALRWGIPARVLTGALTGGLLCAWLPRLYAARHTENFDLAPLPALSTWAVPRLLANVLMGTLLALGLAWLLGGRPAALENLLLIVWSGTEVVFAIQGAALLTYMMKKRGTRPGWRAMWVILLYVFFSRGLMLLGVADQLLDMRGMRPPLPGMRDEEDEL